MYPPISFELVVFAPNRLLKFQMWKLIEFYTTFLLLLPFRGNMYHVDSTVMESDFVSFLRANKDSFLATAACKPGFSFFDAWFRQCWDADAWYSTERSKIELASATVSDSDIYCFKL